jgi:uncharacterized protein (TIGR02246 family)
MCSVAILVSICGCAKKSTPGNRAEDEREIRQSEIEASQAIAAKDLGKLISLYADDAELYDDQGPGIRGKDAIRATWKADFARPDLTMSTDPRTIEISSSGDLAWAHGVFKMTINDSGGRPATEDFDYALVYTKQPDGKWKIMADSANSMLRARLSHRAPEKKTWLAAFAPLIGLACFASLLWFTVGMPIVAIVSAWKFCRSGKLNTGFLVSVVMLAVFFIAAALLWKSLTSHDWNLPLANLFQATTDTARYGNPVEDTSEDVLVALLVLSTLSAAVVGAITGVARRIWIRRSRLAA